MAVRSCALGLALAIGLALGTPAWALLTQAEHDSIRSLHEGAANANDAIKEVVALLETTNTRPLRAAMASLVFGNRSAYNASAYLLDVFPDTYWSSHRHVEFRAQTRAQKVAIAAEDIAATLRRYDVALTGVPAGSSAESKIQAAITMLQSVDTTLAYADPNPPVYPAYFGPHGDYEFGQWQALRALISIFDAFLHLGTIWARPTAAPRELGLATRAAVEAAQAKADSFAHSAGISFTPDEAEWSVVQRALYALNELLQGAADGLRQATVSLSRVGVIEGRWLDAHDAALKNLVNAWFKMDDAVWDSLCGHDADPRIPDPKCAVPSPKPR